MDKGGHTYEKGHPYYARKPKTDAPRKTQPMEAKVNRETVAALVTKLQKGIWADFLRLDPRDRVRFYIELLKFVVPVKQETVVESRSYNDDLRRLCEAYENGSDAPDDQGGELERGVGDILGMVPEAVLAAAGDGE